MIKTPSQIKTLEIMRIFALGEQVYDTMSHSEAVFFSIQQEDPRVDYCKETTTGVLLNLFKSKKDKESQVALKLFRPWIWVGTKYKFNFDKVQKFVAECELLLKVKSESTLEQINDDAFYGLRIRPSHDWYGHTGLISLLMEIVRCGMAHARKQQLNIKDLYTQDDIENVDSEGLQSYVTSALAILVRRTIQKMCELKSGIRWIFKIDKNNLTYKDGEGPVNRFNLLKYGFLECAVAWNDGDKNQDGALTEISNPLIDIKYGLNKKE